MINILLSIATIFITSFYSLQYQDIDGNTVNMSSFQGKKVLLVNIATNSSRVGQLAGLQQLHEQYGDSVVVIAFPSNSFNNEPRTNTEIKQFCQTTYGVTFRIAEKNSVAGASIQSVYNWLAQSSENGELNAVIGTDFQKFLIDKEGKLMGIYSSSVSPTDSSITSAIMSNY